MPFAFKIFRRLARVRPGLIVAGIAVACQPGDNTISAPAKPEFRYTRTTKPAVVSDLAVSDVNDTAATLSFTEVSDGTGSPASYDIRYAVSPLSWGSASNVASGTCTTPIAGTAIGAKRSCTVLGLSRSTAYQFQVVAFRGTLNQNAVFGSLSNVVTATTTASIVASVSVTPTSASGNIGDAAQFTATVKDAAGNTLTGQTVSWSSTNNAVVSVSATGYATAVGGGTAAVVATCGGQSAQAQVTVSGSPAATVATVTVSPSAASGNVGDAAQFTATLKDANGNVITGPTVTWSSTNTAVVTVSATGYGTGVGPGSAAIVATSQGKSGQSQITVSGSTAPGPVATVTVNPSSASIAVGGTQAFSAVLKDANGNVVSGTVTWTSNAPTIAGISSTGLVTALLVGTTTITAASGSVSGTASLTVTAQAPPPPPPPPPSGASWPDEPGGATTLAEHSGDVLTPTGWSVEWNDSGYLAPGLDASAPMSPAGVLQYKWPVGWTNLIGMGALYHDFPATNRVFVGTWWKPSNPWQGHVSNTNKIQYLFTNSSGSIFMAMYGPPGGPYQIVVFPQFTTSLDRWLTPNVNQVPVVLGQWHRLEWLVDYSGAKGHIEWWMDGVLLGNYYDDPPPPEGLIEYKLHPVWGGSETIAKTETDYYWFDQVHVSAF